MEKISDWKNLLFLIIIGLVLRFYILPYLETGDRWLGLLLIFIIFLTGVFLIRKTAKIIELTTGVLKERTGYRRFNSFAEDKKKRFIGWLGRRSVWVILFFLFLPFPVTDILATVALGARGIKYGHWYLAAINLPHIYLVVFLLKLGVAFLFL